jgi:two-component system sensor histidine kinase UhpB
VWQVLLSCLVVALGVACIQRLHQRSRKDRLKAQETERSLRQLVQFLLTSQEEERRSLSRALHGEIAQILTILGVKLNRAAGQDSAVDSAATLSASRQLLDGVVRRVQELAAQIRPPMLDELGLHPALECEARDFSLRYGTPVQLIVTGELAWLSDSQRTCIYRVVQDALTRCVGHSGASRITVAIRSRQSETEVFVVDDGGGIEPVSACDRARWTGIEERVRDIGGTAAITRVVGHGTTLTLRLPTDLRDERQVTAGADAPA